MRITDIDGVAIYTFPYAEGVFVNIVEQAEDEFSIAKARLWAEQNQRAIQLYTLYRFVGEWDTNYLKSGDCQVVFENGLFSDRMRSELKNYLTDMGNPQKAELAAEHIIQTAKKDATNQAPRVRKYDHLSNFGKSFLDGTWQSQVSTFQARKEALLQSPKHNGGFVYLLFLSCTGHHKIGKSVHPETRVWKQISPKLPEEPELICVIKTDNMNRQEDELHKKFSDKRTNGEWFKLDQEDVEYIKGLANE